MEFDKNTNYPKWDTGTKVVPGIPDWETTIGEFVISFKKGSKNCFITKSYSGDYTVHITSNTHSWKSKQYTDENLWETLLIPNINQLSDRQSFIVCLREILTNKVENDLLGIINKYGFNDELKVCLYTLWHRAIIEDRLYSPPRYLGHKQVIGMTIAIIKKIDGATFENDSLIKINPLVLDTDLRCKECKDFYDL